MISSNYDTLDAMKKHGLIGLSSKFKPPRPPCRKCNQQDAKLVDQVGVTLFFKLLMRLLLICVYCDGCKMFGAYAL